MLLQDNRVDPSDDNNYAIQWAAERGHKEIVEMLLKDKRVDPSDRSLLYASEFGRTEVVELLLQGAICEMYGDRIGDSVALL
jgi:ankyrin repeat protein